MERFGFLVAAVGSAVAWLYTFTWNQDDPAPESLSQRQIASTVFVLDIVLWVAFETFNSDARKARAIRQKSWSDLCQTLDDDIITERRNFMQIARRVQYSSESHQRTVEYHSFRILDESLDSVVKHWRFRGLAKAIQTELRRNMNLPDGQKDVSRLVPLVDKLHRRLWTSLPKVFKDDCVASGIGPNKAGP
jgi:hypothetical protein